MGAAVAMIVGGAILNATAFVGGSYVAKAASGGDDMKEEHEKELKRHDLALENFNKDRELWLEHRQKVLDFIAKQKNLDVHARQNLVLTDQNLNLYLEFHPESTQSTLTSLENEPEFSDYYQPSDDMKLYQYIYLAGGGILLVYLIKKYNII